MEWLTFMCFGYTADAGVVIKEGGVVVPSEQQGLSNNRTCSLAISWEALGKNYAREQSGQTDFSCRLWSAVWAPQLNVSFIWDGITSIGKLTPILNYLWSFCLTTWFKSFCVLRLPYALAVDSRVYSPLWSYYLWCTWGFMFLLSLFQIKIANFINLSLWGVF